MLPIACPVHGREASRVDGEHARRSGARVRPPASSVARASPAATASTRSTSATDGGGAPSQLPDRTPGERRGQRGERARARSVVAGPRARRELVEVLRFCTQDVGLAGEHRDEVALRERATAAGGPRAGPRRGGTRGRRSSGRRRTSSAERGAERARVGAAEVEQRTHEPPVPRRHAREPGRAPRRGAR